MREIDYYYVEINGFKILKSGEHFHMLKMSKKLGRTNGTTAVKLINELSVKSHSQLPRNKITGLVSDD